jgi:hypothetical protein
MKKILKSIAVLLSITILSLPLTISASESRQLLEETPFLGVGNVTAHSAVNCFPIEGCTLSKEDFPDFDIELFLENTKDVYTIVFSTFDEAFIFMDTVATNEKIAKTEILRNYDKLFDNPAELHFEGDELVFDGYWTDNGKFTYDEEGRLIYLYPTKQYLEIPEDMEVTRVKLPNIREIIAAEKASFENLRYGYVCDSETIGIGDVILLSKHVSKKLTLPADSQNYKNANCDLRDNAVNADDLKAMIDYLLGTIDSLPVR